MLRTDEKDEAIEDVVRRCTRMAIVLVENIVATLVMDELVYVGVRRPILLSYPVGIVVGCWTS